MRDWAPAKEPSARPAAHHHETHLPGPTDADNHLVAVLGHANVGPVALEPLLHRLDAEVEGAEADRDRGPLGRCLPSGMQAS